MSQDEKKTVFLSESVKALLAAATALLASEDNTGCDPSLTVVESAPIEALRAAAAQVATQERNLVVGIYDHVHGQNGYLFALPPGETFTHDDFVEFIESQGIKFEADREFISLDDDDLVDLGGHAGDAGSGMEARTGRSQSGPRIG